MLTDGIDLVDGSSITNMTVASGTSLPNSPTPNDGELFYLTTGSIGLYVYDATNTSWNQITTGTGVNAGGGATAHGFSVHQSASTSLTTGANVIVQFNTVEFDTDTAFDTANYKYVIPVAGKWTFSFSCYAVGAVGSAAEIYSVCSIYVNGSVKKKSVFVGPNSYGQIGGAVTATLDLALNDQVTFLIYVGSNSGSLGTGWVANQNGSNPWTWATGVCFT